MSKWREATAVETRAWLGGYPLANLTVRETEEGLEVIDSAVYANAMTRAEIAYTQYLWYAWGRLDSGVYPAEVKEKIAVFDFARIGKDETLAFELEDTFILRAIQERWREYVDSVTR